MVPGREIGFACRSIKNMERNCPKLRIIAHQLKRAGAACPGRKDRVIVEEYYQIACPKISSIITPTRNSEIRLQLHEINTPSFRRKSSLKLSNLLGIASLVDDVYPKLHALLIYSARYCGVSRFPSVPRKDPYSIHSPKNYS